MSPHPDGPTASAVRPASLARLAEGGRILSQADMQALVQRLFGLAQGGGWMKTIINNWWAGELRWARNRVSLASDRRDIDITALRTLQGVSGQASTNQLDPASLAGVVRTAERSALVRGGEVVLQGGYRLSEPEVPLPKESIWSDATFDLATETRGELARAVIEPAEAHGLLSAGYLEVRAAVQAVETNVDGMVGRSFQEDYREWTEDGMNVPTFQAWPAYAVWTVGQCSVTVRDPQGTGSGWAGLSSYNWGDIDLKALGERAVEKCLASRNPVALEPGRYTVILEAQAMADLLTPLISGPVFLSREWPETRHTGPWLMGRDPALEDIYRSKVGLKVADERVTISHDPTDPHLGVIPYRGLAPITWIKNGVLTELGHSRQYALEALRENLPAQSSAGSYQMSGGPTTTEEMIQSTKRGLLVTRFSQVKSLPVPNPGFLYTGLTRDGLWLIENGKVTKPVKNMRFTESPLFVLNSLEQLGVPVPVFRVVYRGTTPVIVPPVKVRDFSFTAMVDAI